MCIVIDANQIGAFFAQVPDVDATPVLDWIEKGHGTVIYGGYLCEELGRSPAVANWLAEAVRAGRARLADPHKVEEEEKALSTEELRSNDPHIIALARATGARLLYSHDQRLIDDFTNPRLVRQPRGKVYKRKANASLLTRDACRQQC